MNEEKTELRPVELTSAISAQPAGAIEKACRVLKAMSDRRNIRLTDIAAHCGFEKSTTGRILDLLIAEGMVVRHPVTKCYGFGPEVARISRGVGEALDWHAIAHGSLDRIAAEFGDTAIMSLLSGLELVCVDLQAGHYPIRAQYQDIGSRRTVGAGSSGVAVLAALDPNDRAAMLPQLLPRLGRFPMLTKVKLESLVARASAVGYAVLIDAIVPRMGGIGIAIRDASGAPIGALSISALAERITEREAELAVCLTREASVVETEIAKRQTS
jgi:DNA-binding IclR family transcriptional regulator